MPGIVAGPYARLEVGDRIEVETFAEPDFGLTLLRFRPARSERRHAMGGARTVIWA